MVKRKKTISVRFAKKNEKATTNVTNAELVRDNKVVLESLEYILNMHVSDTMVNVLERVTNNVNNVSEKTLANQAKLRLVNDDTKFLRTMQSLSSTRCTLSPQVKDYFIKYWDNTLAEVVRTIIKYPRGEYKNAFVIILFRLAQPSFKFYCKNDCSNLNVQEYPLTFAVCEDMKNMLLKLLFKDPDRLAKVTKDKSIDILDDVIVASFGKKCSIKTK